MSYHEWGYIGYGIDIYELNEKYIDERKLKKLFLENKYSINEVFQLEENDIQNIQKVWFELISSGVFRMVVTI